MQAKEKVSLKVGSGTFEVVSDKEIKLDAESKVAIKSKAGMEVSDGNEIKVKA